MKDLPGKPTRIEYFNAIDLALKTIPTEIEPPAGFKESVLAKLHQESTSLTHTHLSKQKSFFTNQTWQVLLAGAALFMFLIGGSAIINDTPSKDSGSATIASTGLDHKQNIENRLAHTNTPTLQTPLPNDPTFQEQPSQPNNTSHSNSTSTMKAASDPKEANTAPSASDNSTDVDAPKPNGSVKTQDAVLLSDAKIIESAFLKYRVTSLDSALLQAEQFASTYNASIASKELQRGQGLHAVSLTLKINPNDSAAFMTSLDKIGTLLEKKADSQDITQQYLRLSEEVVALTDRIHHSSGESKVELESRLLSLKNQIEKWDKDILSFTFVIWLEQM